MCNGSHAGAWEPVNSCQLKGLLLALFQLCCLAYSPQNFHHFLLFSSLASWPLSEPLPSSFRFCSDFISACFSIAFACPEPSCISCCCFLSLSFIFSFLSSLICSFFIWAINRLEGLLWVPIAPLWRVKLVFGPFSHCRPDPSFFCSAGGGKQADPGEGPIF